MFDNPKFFAIAIILILVIPVFIMFFDWILANWILFLFVGAAIVSLYVGYMKFIRGSGNATSSSSLRNIP